MTIEQVKAFLRFWEKPVVELYLEIVNLTKTEKQHIQYLLDGMSIKEISNIEHIEQRTADDRRKKSCEKLALAWSGHGAVIAIANYVLEKERKASE